MLELFFLYIVLAIIALSLSLSLISAPIYEMEQHCYVELAALISRVSSTQNGIEFS